MISRYPFPSKHFGTYFQLSTHESILVHINSSLVPMSVHCAAREINAGAGARLGDYGGAFFAFAQLKKIEKGYLCWLESMWGVGLSCFETIWSVWCGDVIFWSCRGVLGIGALLTLKLSNIRTIINLDSNPEFSLYVWVHERLIHLSHFQDLYLLARWGRSMSMPLTRWPLK